MVAGPSSGQRHGVLGDRDFTSGPRQRSRWIRVPELRALKHRTCARTSIGPARAQDAGPDDVPPPASTSCWRCQLEGLARATPGSCSGGQAQRVAFARGYAIWPPGCSRAFGALDSTGAGSSCATGCAFTTSATSRAAGDPRPGRGDGGPDHVVVMHEGRVVRRVGQQQEVLDRGDAVRRVFRRRRPK